MRQVSIYVHVVGVNLHRCIFLFLCMHPAARKQQFSHICNIFCVCVDSPVSLQLSAVLSEGRPQVPGVPRGVVAHSSGSRNHDAFCRHTQKKLEVERWNGTRSLEACGHYSDTQRRQVERRKRRGGLAASSHLLGQTGARSGEVLHVRLGAALPLVQDEVCGHFTLQTGDVAMTEVVAQVMHLRRTDSHLSAFTSSPLFSFIISFLARF